MILQNLPLGRTTWCPFYQHGLTLIPAWISRCMYVDVWDKIIPKFKQLHNWSWKWIYKNIPRLWGMSLLIHAQLIHVNKNVHRVCDQHPVRAEILNQIFAELSEQIYKSMAPSYLFIRRDEFIRAHQQVIHPIVRINRPKWNKCPSNLIYKEKSFVKRAPDVNHSILHIFRDVLFKWIIFLSWMIYTAKNEVPQKEIKNVPRGNMPECGLTLAWKVAWCCNVTWLYRPAWPCNSARGNADAPFYMTMYINRCVDVAVTSL